MNDLSIKIDTNVEELQKLLDEAKTCARLLEKSLEAINSFSLEGEIEFVSEKSE